MLIEMGHFGNILNGFYLFGPGLVVPRLHFINLGPKHVLGDEGGFLVCVVAIVTPLGDVK